MFKKILGTIFFVVGIMLILAGFLVTFIPLVEGSRINLGVLSLSGQLIGVAVVVLFIGIKLIDSEKWKKVFGVIMIIFGLLFGLSLIIMNIYYTSELPQGMPLAFGIISVSMLFCGVLSYKKS